MKADKILWQALSAYDMDAAGAALPFSRRLARDAGWSYQKALAAISEYKRFIYLVCVDDQMLTPSDVVDEVWHLHLLYTEDYWDRFCAGTLGRKIHHGPTKGGSAEKQRYHDAYGHTLDLYARTFGSPPPKDFWPEPAIRFARPTPLINSETHIYLPKRQVFLCLSIAMPLFLVACTAGPLLRQIGTYWVFIIFAGIFLFAFFNDKPRKPDEKRRKKDDGGSGFGSSGCGGHGCGSGCGGGCGGGCGS